VVYFLGSIINNAEQAFGSFNFLSFFAPDLRFGERLSVRSAMASLILLSIGQPPILPG
jgi:hypothetical protein